MSSPRCWGRGAAVTGAGVIYGSVALCRCRAYRRRGRRYGGDRCRGYRHGGHGCRGLAAVPGSSQDPCYSSGRHTWMPRQGQLQGGMARPGEASPVPQFPPCLSFPPLESRRAKGTNALAGGRAATPGLGAVVSWLGGARWARARSRSLYRRHPAACATVAPWYPVHGAAGLDSGPGPGGAAEIKLRGSKAPAHEEVSGCWRRCHAGPPGSWGQRGPCHPLSQRGWRRRPRSPRPAVPSPQRLPP